MRRKLAAGNWKMHGLTDSLSQLQALAQAHAAPQVDVLICPPATLLTRASDVARSTSISIGAQDCHSEDMGAHTGDLSAIMLKDAGATHVILGHSERRADHGETDATVCAKTITAEGAGLIPIVCIGESLAEREAGTTLEVLTKQLAGSLPDDITDHLVVAYEPIWAIGTGLTPSSVQIAEAHAHMRAELAARFGETTAQSIRLLYGGSVKAANAAEIFAIPDVDGALVGGASLKAEDFSPIISALENA